jgi:hypothetical protein
MLICEKTNELNCVHIKHRAFSLELQTEKRIYSIPTNAFSKNEQSKLDLELQAEITSNLFLARKENTMPGSRGHLQKR